MSYDLLASIYCILPTDYDLLNFSGLCCVEILAKTSFKSMQFKNIVKEIVINYDIISIAQ